MKIQSLTVIALISLASSSAFCAQQQIPRAFTSLQASRQNFWTPVATAAVGWTLASQIAMAGALPADQKQCMAPTSSSLVVSDEKLDFSLPSYDPNSNTVGFGTGTEAYLSGQSGEAELQAQAAEKAEAARKARLEEKKIEMKRKEAEDRVRNLEKKAERERRMKGIFE